jgi:hypothetical protein
MTRDIMARRFRQVIEAATVLPPLETFLDWARYNLAPEEVFNAEDLEEWAEAHGFTKQTEEQP